MVFTRVKRQPNVVSASDDLLIARAKRGDGEALESLYRLHEGRVYNLARRICRKPEDAEEVLQETFVELARSLPSFRGDGSFAGWIRRIAVTKALMRLRHDRLRAADSLEDATASDLQSAHHFHEQARGNARLDLESALNSLPAMTRAVVWLHDVEGYTHEEIAELSGRSVSFSKSRLARAHDRLRSSLRSGGGNS